MQTIRAQGASRHIQPAGAAIAVRVHGAPAGQLGVADGACISFPWTAHLHFAARPLPPLASPDATHGAQHTARRAQRRPPAGLRGRRRVQAARRELRGAARARVQLQPAAGQRAAGDGAPRGRCGDAHLQHHTRRSDAAALGGCCAAASPRLSPWTRPPCARTSCGCRRAAPSAPSPASTATRGSAQQAVLSCTAVFSSPFGWCCSWSVSPRGYIGPSPIFPWDCRAVSLFT